MPQPFRAYLTAQQRRDDPVGQIARYLLATPGRHGWTAKGLRQFMLRHGFPGASQQALDHAVREWRGT